MRNTDIVADIKQSLQSGYYGLVNLALASVAYVSNKDTSKMGQAFNDTFNKALDPLPNPQNGTIPDGAKWNLEWGPAVAGKNANLSYVATFGISDTNYLRVVGLRGTNVASTDTGILEQLIEDLNAFKQTNWMDTLEELALDKNFNPFERKVRSGFDIEVAMGSTEALKLLLTGKIVTGGNGEDNLINHLYAQSDINDTPLVVTGHSLGGALTQVVSAYFAWQIGAAFTKIVDVKGEPVLDNILPTAFAPPTVGGPDFAARYDHIFPNNYFYYNDGDVVPYAYCDVMGIENLWSNYNTDKKTCTQAPCPQNLIEIINNLSESLPSYMRPKNNTIELTANYLCNGPCMQDFLKEVNMGAIDPKSWIAQLVWQHFPPCYYKCINQNVNNLASYPSFIPIPASCK